MSSLAELLRDHGLEDPNVTADKMARLNSADSQASENNQARRLVFHETSQACCIS